MNFPHENILWRGTRAVIYFILTKQVFLHFYRHGDWFYNRYIDKKRKNRLDDDDTGLKPVFLQKGMRYTLGYNPINQLWDRYQKIERGKFGRKCK